MNNIETILILQKINKTNTIMTKTKSRNIKRQKKLKALKKQKEREVKGKFIEQRFDEFLLKNKLDKTKMTQKELSIARSFMKAQEECPYA